jgi:hypothetical protein
LLVVVQKVQNGGDIQDEEKFAITNSNMQQIN